MLRPCDSVLYSACYASKEEVENAMPYTIRAATPADEPFLWQMLFYAANMADDGAISGDQARDHPYLAKYVRGWGRNGDVGTLAVDLASDQLVGAAWVRLLEGSEKNYPGVAESIPELAIAVVPEFLGQGIGTRLLAGLFAAAAPTYLAIVLSVRDANPARRLYERVGFTVVDTVVNRVGGSSFVMVRQLP
jgi:ribosomal protein S18 acetylase RimI-like enzyme